MKNSEKFPYNIYEPYKLEVFDEEYDCYMAKFSSLYDLYNYLKSNPNINRSVFTELSSVYGEESFAGVPYDNAVEELIAKPRKEYDDFLKLSNRLSSNNVGYVKEYIDVKSPAGGVIDIPAYSSGNPLCYKISRSIYVPKFIRLNVGLSYSWSTSKKQVLNRALIISSLISAFENAGYMVNVNTFELSHCYDELAYKNVNIKNTDETFNKSSLYKTLCYVEFLRRILFRVLETLDVSNYWSSGYGSTCREEFCRKALKFSDSDLYIGEPNEMDITGRDIVKDFNNVVYKLSLDDFIDTKLFEKDFEKNIKKLELGIK